LKYDAETGHFTDDDGRRIGHQRKDGYRAVGQHLEHRLAWFGVTGQWPAYQIDHINGDKTDNRWANLRAATPSQNKENIHRPQANNKSGFLGVTWHKRDRRWRATLRVQGRAKHLGYFDTPEAAHCAYLGAKRVLHQFNTL
jgi:hypothetical protein